MLYNINEIVCFFTFLAPVFLVVKVSSIFDKTLSIVKRQTIYVGRIYRQVECKPSGWWQWSGIGDPDRNLYVIGPARCRLSYSDPKNHLCNVDTKSAPPDARCAAVRQRRSGARHIAACYSK